MATPNVHFIKTRANWCSAGEGKIISPGSQDLPAQRVTGGDMPCSIKGKVKPGACLPDVGVLILPFGVKYGFYLYILDIALDIAVTGICR